MAEATAWPVLAVDQLARHFPVRGFLNRQVGTARVLDGVSFSIFKGETLGLIGESGCGKSTLGKVLAGILDPDRGTIRLGAEQIAAPGQTRPAAARARLQYVYQDPGAALDPRWTLRRSLDEPLVIHTDWPRERRAEKIGEIVAALGLPPAHLDLHPHEISGGQLRRAGLARTLILGPELVVLDEPTAGLDASVKAAVMGLLRDLKRRFDLTYLFMSHDLPGVRSACDRIAVMYLGRIVETGPTERIFTAPGHPYTRSLMAAVPRIGGPRLAETFTLRGEPPDPANVPSGCRFRTRCPLARPACAEVEPGLEDEAGHAVACLRRHG